MPQVLPNSVAVGQVSGPALRASSIDCVHHYNCVQHAPPGVGVVQPAARTAVPVPVHAVSQSSATQGPAQLAVCGVGGCCAAVQRGVHRSIKHRGRHGGGCRLTPGHCPSKPTASMACRHRHVVPDEFSRTREGQPDCGRAFTRTCFILAHKRIKASCVSCCCASAARHYAALWAVKVR